MLHRTNSNELPLLHAVVEYYPFSMLLSLVSCIIWQGSSLSSSSPYAILPMLQSAALIYGFYREFERLVPHPQKITNDFRDEKYFINGQLVAELKSTGGSTPILEIYSSDPIIIGLARGYFLGMDFIDMRKRYLPLLYLNAQLVIGPRFQDTVTSINQQILARDINVNVQDKIPEFHYFLLEANKAVILHNSSPTRPKAIHVPYINIDELMALQHFPDDKKGLAIGCSVAYHPDGFFIRNFDWPSAGNLFNHVSRSISPTNHVDPKKPQFIMAWTLPFGSVLTATNGHLVLAMNEVEKHKTMRKYQGENNGGYGQFDLFEMITKNCCTIEEIHSFIEKHPPASPWILNVTAKDGGGIFEMLPTVKDKNQPLYRFIPATPHCISTNHFQGMPETAAVSCSLTRYEKMRAASQRSTDPWEIARSSATKDTGHTLIAKWKNGKLILQSNIANYNSATAVDRRRKKFRYDEINVDEYSQSFINKTPLLRPYKSLPVDQALMDLLNMAYQVKDQNISSLIRIIYSDLMVERTKNDYKKNIDAPIIVGPVMSIKNITAIAIESKNIVTAMMSGRYTLEEKMALLNKYQNAMNAINPTQPVQSPNRRYYVLLTATLFITSLMVLFNSDLTLDLLSSGLTYFLDYLAPSTAVIAAVAPPLFNTLKTQNNVFSFTHSMSQNLQKEVSDNKNEKKIIYNRLSH